MNNLLSLLKKYIIFEIDNNKLKKNEKGVGGTLEFISVICLFVAGLLNSLFFQGLIGIYENKTGKIKKWKVVYETWIAKTIYFLA